MNPASAIARYQQIQATLAQFQAIATARLNSADPTPLIVLQYVAWATVDLAISTVLAPSPVTDQASPQPSAPYPSELPTPESPTPKPPDPAIAGQSMTGQGRTGQSTAGQATAGQATAGQATAGQAIACQPGCDWCCYLPVPIDFLEAIAITQYLRATASDPELAVWRERVQAIAGQLDAISPRDRLAHRIPCAFLHDHQCQIYPVRPAACRGCHSTNAHICETGFWQGQWQGRSVGDIDFVAPTIAAALQAAAIAAGWPMGTLDLNRAISMLLQPAPGNDPNPNSSKNHLKK